MKKLLLTFIACLFCASVQAQSISDEANTVFRDYKTPGQPLSGRWDPPKADVRALFGTVANRAGVSIRDYGAKCDGTTNDGPAINSALAASNVVIIPQGSNSCVVNTTVTLGGGKTLRFARGQGINYNAAATCLLTTGTNDTIHLSGPGNTIDSLCITHNGTSGSAVSDQGGGGINYIINSSISGNSDTSTSSLVYFKSSANVVRGGSIANSRPAGGFGLIFDAVGGAGQIANRVEGVNFAAQSRPHAGEAIYIGSLDGTARQEGVQIVNNQFVGQGDSNLFIGNVLSAHIIGNIFDQGYASQIVVAPNASMGITDVHFTSNYISTPNQQTTGVCVNYINPSNHFVSGVSFVDNSFAFCGFGSSFTAPASDISYIGNRFSGIGSLAIGLGTGTGKSIVQGNSFSAIAPNFCLSGADNTTGGPYIINGNNFESSCNTVITITNASKWIWEANAGIGMPAGLPPTTVIPTTCSTNQFVNAVNNSGVPTCATPTTGSSTAAAGSSGQFQTNSAGSLAGVTISGAVSIDGTTGISTFASSPTFTGTASAPNISATSAANPSYLWSNTAASADSKTWQFIDDAAGSLNLFAINDTGTAGNLALQLTRTGITPTGASFRGSVNSTDFYAGQGLLATGGAPLLRETNTSAATDTRIWDLVTDTSGTLTIRTVNDAVTSFNNALTISRSGTTPDTVTVGNLVVSNGSGPDDLINWVPFSERAAVLNNTSTYDATNSVNVALATGKSFVMCGTYNIRNQISPAQGTKLEGCGPNKAHFNMTNTGALAWLNYSASSVFKLTHGVEIAGVSFDFVQPDTTVRASMTAYPPAIGGNGTYGDQAQGVRVENIQCNRGWTCLNTNGNVIGTFNNLRLGAFFNGWYMDGAMDYVRISNVEFWWYGMTTNQRIAAANNSCMDIGEGPYNFTNIQTWYCGIIIHAGNAGNLAGGGDPFVTLNGVSLDTAYIFPNAGVTIVNGVYGTKDGTSAWATGRHDGYYFINGGTSRMTISGADVLGNGEQIVYNNGGKLTIDSSYLRQACAACAIVQNDSGDMVLGSSVVLAGYTGTPTHSFHAQYQTGGSLSTYATIDRATLNFSGGAASVFFNADNANNFAEPKRYKGLTAIGCAFTCNSGSLGSYQ